MNVLAEEIAHRSQSRFHDRPSVVVEAESDEHFIQPGMLGHSNLLPVVKRSFAARGDEPIVASWIENHAALRVTRAIVSDGNCELRNAMQEVVRAVDRVNHPQMLGV